MKQHAHIRPDFEHPGKYCVDIYKGQIWIKTLPCRTMKEAKQIRKEIRQAS